MILNAYSVLDMFLVLLRFFLGLLVVGLGLLAWRQARLRHQGEERTLVEERGYLLLLLTVVLVALNVASWPLFYLLLQSYVAQWSSAGVMCIFGVTRIGTDSLGSARFLPALVETLQLTKPLLVFLCGSWFVLYLINRRTTTGPLLGRLLLLLVAVGLFAAADAAVEAAYLLIPKQEEYLAAGCCTEAVESASRAERFVPQAFVGQEHHMALYVAYYAINLGMALALFLFARVRGRFVGKPALSLLCLGAAISIPVSAVFLVDVAAPALLQLPHHHCVYDLLPQAPESVAAIALFVIGCFAVGWAGVAAWLGDAPQTRPYVTAEVSNLLFLALFGYAGSLAMMTVELALV